MRRVVTVIALMFGFVVTTAAAASADAGGFANTGSDGIDHGAHNDDAGTGSDSDGGAATCTYHLTTVPDGVPVYEVDGTILPSTGVGHWYEKWCGPTDFAGIFFVTDRDPHDLALEARRHLRLPLPTPRLSPAGDQIVNLATWLWIEPSGWVRRQSTVTVPGVSVTVLARPASVIWHLGDGTIVRCTGPGVPFDPRRAEAAQASTCSHIFERSSANTREHAFAATVTVRWHATWTVAGAPGGGDLGFIDFTTAFPIRVGEVQAVNTDTK